MSRHQLDLLRQKMIRETECFLEEELGRPDAFNRTSSLGDTVAEKVYPSLTRDHRNYLRSARQFGN